MNKLLIVFTILTSFILSEPSAFAHHRYHSRHSRHSHRGHHLFSALAGVKPAIDIEENQCDVKIDCPNYKITIGGEDAGQIICDSTSGADFSGKVVKLGKEITPSQGTYLPVGFPMLATSPELCGACYIHVYPYVGPGHTSLGCVGVTETAWNKLVKCAGSQIAFTAMSGVQSEPPPIIAPPEYADASKDQVPEGAEATVTLCSDPKNCDKNQAPEQKN
jgi:hypothetical protein